MKNASRWLAVVLGLHLVLGLVYDWATPIFEAPDEGYHFAMVRWISLGHGLPIQRPGVKADWEQEGSQPPLYHALVAGLTGWINTSDWPDVFVWNRLSQIGVPGTRYNANLYRHTRAEAFPYHDTALAVHVGRWFSLGLSLVTIVLAYWLSLAVFRKREQLALLAAALVALNPQAIFINASVNNDNLLMLLSTASLLVILRCMPPTPAGVSQASRFKRDLPWLFLLGLLLGLAALTKVSGLVLWPMAALGVGWGCLNGERNWRKAEGWRFIASGVIIAGMALLVSGWWFWRNQVLYGDWFGLNVMVAIAGPRTIALADLIRNEWYSFYSSYWAVFGVFTILPPAWVQVFFGALTLLSLAGGAVALAQQRAWPRAEAWLLALFCALTLAGVIRWTMQTFASQGRLAFGALAPLSIFMAAGLLAALRGVAQLFKFRLSDIGPGLWTWGGGAFIFGLAAVALVLAVFDIAPHYAPPPVVAESQLPREMQAVHAVFGDQIELIGYTADTALRHPGESQRVTLYWRARQPLTQDYALALHLIGRGVEEVGKLDTWPGGGNAPTSQWQPGVILADTYWLPITRTATTPSLLKLNLAFWEGQADHLLPVTGAGGEALKTVTLSAGRVGPLTPPTFKPAIVEGTKFEYGISLLGADAGNAGRISLYWQTDQTIPADYTVFLHLVDAAGRQVAQADGPPLNGDWPTSAWVPGQALADSRQFDLQALAPGRYTVQLGFYDPASGARVAAFRADGSEWPDDIVSLKDVVEIK